MGCSMKEINVEQSKSNAIQYENYTQSNPNTMEVYFYRLDWKIRPEICVFLKLEERIIEKEEANNIDDLIESVQFQELKNIDSLIEGGYIIYYLYCDKGVVITRNIDKINYFLGVKLNEIIKLCIVDISSVIISESEYLSIHEIKKQTKYLFNLSNKEINFKERNELVNNGKDENLSETEIDLNDEIIEEDKEQNIFLQTVNPSLLIRDNNENKRDGDQENEDGNELINGENNEKELEFNQKENNSKINDNNNINNIHSAIKNFVENDGKNEDINEMDENNEENEVEEKPYEIQNDTLIISASEMTSEINKELEKILFNTSLKDVPPFDYIGYYNEENNKKPKKRKRKEVSDNIQNKVNEGDEEYNDYIIINKKDGIPYEKKICLHQIKKIIFKNCSFSSNSIFYLKQFVIMISKYNLLKLAIYRNFECNTSIASL